MTDERLRELERRWKESGAVEDEATYLRELVRQDVLSQERLRLAAHLGHRASRTTLDNGFSPASGQLEDRVRLLRQWGQEACIRAAVAAVRMGLEGHEEVPTAATDAVQTSEEWICNPSEALLQKAIESSLQAAAAGAGEEYAWRFCPGGRIADDELRGQHGSGGAQDYRAEFLREVAPPNPSLIRDLLLVAHTGRTDDITGLVLDEKGQPTLEFADVHLTYTSNPPEAAGWPHTTRFPSLARWVRQSLLCHANDLATILCYAAGSIACPASTPDYPEFNASLAAFLVLEITPPRVVRRRIEHELVNWALGYSDSVRDRVTSRE